MTAIHQSLRNRIGVALLCGVLLSGCGAAGAGGRGEVVIPSRYAAGEVPALKGGDNAFASLSVPTCFAKLGDWYFIVDCYHNQILVNDNLEDPIVSWKVMTSDISMGHTIAGDGTVYVVDDTEQNRVLVFTEEGGAFSVSQEIDGVGERPHFVVYDPQTQLFNVWSSMTGEMIRYRREEGSNLLVQEDVLSIPELNGIYVRSFTIEGNKIYLPTADGRIYEADKKTLAVKKIYQVPEQIAGMVQLMHIDNAYYLTVSTDLYGSQDAATIVRAKSLAALAAGDYEDVYDRFVGGGTPYYMTCVEGKYYLTEHRLNNHALWRFDVRDHEIADVEAIY